MQENYRHVPITGPRSIRVIHLEPAPDLSAPIQCSLKAVSLNDYPEWHAHYTALSYTWGGQNPSCEVDCGGKRLLVTQNCDLAMRHLRDKQHVQVLWIDAICIDQSKEATRERNNQVALMGEIYKSAAKVVVWLSESSTRVEKAIAKMMEIATVGRRSQRVDDSEGVRAFKEIGRIQPSNDKMKSRRAVQDSLRENAERMAASESHNRIRPSIMF
jgi:hypothetical protein